MLERGQPAPDGPHPEPAVPESIAAEPALPGRALPRRRRHGRARSRRHTRGPRESPLGRMQVAAYTPAGRIVRHRTHYGIMSSDVSCSASRRDAAGQIRRAPRPSVCAATALLCADRARAPGPLRQMDGRCGPDAAEAGVPVRGVDGLQQARTGPAARGVVDVSSAGVGLASVRLASVRLASVRLAASLTAQCGRHQFDQVQLDRRFGRTDQP